MLVWIGLTGALLGATPDPGLLLDLDREHFELRARDLRDGSAGPSIRVALGSPANATPSGSFPLFWVVRNPSWQPGERARAAGAEPLPASDSGPLGVAKLPFARGGIALHGGADPRLLGKPVSLGCVRSADRDLLALLDWLEARGAMGAREPRPNGEIHQPFQRPARITVH